jgi:hypothetical protein
MKRAVLVLLVALGLGGAIHAQPPAGARQVCAPTNSEAATVAVIAADLAAWIGRCVSVEAIYAGEQLHADADAIYGVNGNSIGGYVDGRGDVGGAWRGVFTGRVADCAQAEEDLLTGLLRSPGISLHGRTLGCLEPTGPFLVFMSQGELTPAGIKRRLPGEGGGNLQRTGADWKHYAILVNAGQTFELGMQGSDASYLATVIGDDYAAEHLHAGNGSALAALRGLRPEQFDVFRDTSVNAQGQFAGEACWCLTSDCTKLWPIHSRDADNQPSRPYACLRVEGREEGDGITSSRVDASNDVYGLDEP